MISGATHGLDIGYGNGQRAAPSFSLHHHQFHTSQSMHNEHHGKNLSKAQQAAHLDSYGKQPNGGRAAQLIHSTTPPPMMVGDSHYGNSARGLVSVGNPNVQGGYGDLYHANNHANSWY